MYMYRYLGLFILFVFVASCSSSRPVVRTTKTVSQTPKVDPRKNKKTTPVRSVATTTPKSNPVGTATEVEKNRIEGGTNSSGTPVQTMEVLEATTAVKVTTAMVLAYIDRYKEIAKKDMVEYGIPASITLGQGILESGAGSGPLSVQANNHFGIKCHKEWTGPSVSYDDDSVGECFRKYSHPHESFKDHSLFLVTRERYASLFRLELDDYKGWSKGLKAAGYATDPAYPTKLITLIEKYQLYRFDAEVLGKAIPQIQPMDTITQRNNSINSPKNNTEQHTVIKGDTLFSIAKKYNLSVDDLKRKNNLTDNAIAIGQTLIVK